MSLADGVGGVVSTLLPYRVSRGGEGLLVLQGMTERWCVVVSFACAFELTFAHPHHQGPPGPRGLPAPQGAKGHKVHVWECEKARDYITLVVVLPLLSVSR